MLWESILTCLSTLTRSCMGPRLPITSTLDRRRHNMPLATFTQTIASLTQPFNGQFPRPWMTSLSDPLSANVYVVGQNQAKGYPCERISHQRHLDALFNLAGESCRGLYDELTGGMPSPTRENIDGLSRELQLTAGAKVLETNVICYSTPMSADLRLDQHAGGAQLGTEIFSALLCFGKPKVLVAHGVGTRQVLSKLLGAPLPPMPQELCSPEQITIAEISIFIIPSLAQPAWNKWHNWSGEYLARVANAVAAAV